MNVALAVDLTLFPSRQAEGEELAEAVEKFSPCGDSWPVIAWENVPAQLCFTASAPHS